MQEEQLRVLLLSEHYYCRLPPARPTSSSNIEASFCQPDLVGLPGGRLLLDGRVVLACVLLSPWTGPDRREIIGRRRRSRRLLLSDRTQAAK